MKTIKNTITLKFEVNNSLLLDGKYLPLRTLYDMVKAQEEQDDCRYKGYRNALYNSVSSRKYNRNALYNSVSSRKYNIETKYGIKCINVYRPMVEGFKASLEFEFKVV